MQKEVDNHRVALATAKSQYEQAKDGLHRAKETEVRFVFSSCLKREIEYRIGSLTVQVVEICGLIIIEKSTHFPPMWPGFKSRRRRHLWVEVVVGFLYLFRDVFLWVLRFFSGYSGRHFQIPIRSETHGHV